MRILLIEDDAVLRGVMLRSFNDAGHRVDVATNIEDARHWWRVQAFDASAAGSAMAWWCCARRARAATARRCWC
jgi:DNA-binding response OmpR family regulator